MLLGTWTTRMPRCATPMAAALRTMSSPPMQTSASILSLRSAATRVVEALRIAGRRRGATRRAGRRRRGGCATPRRSSARAARRCSAARASSKPSWKPMGTHAELDGLDGDRADDAVGAGGGTAADDDADAFDGMVDGQPCDAHRGQRRRAPGTRTAAGTRRARGAPASASRSTHAGVLEVLGLEANHVGARDPEALAPRCRPAAPWSCPSPGRAGRRSGMGTSRPPWMLTIAPLPPPARKRIAL